MPKITIDLPAEINEKLKAKAKEDYRTLTNYITVALINLANDIPTVKPGIVYSPVFPTPAIPEQSPYPYPYTVTATQTQASTLEQLQEQGVTQIKFKNQNNQAKQKTLTPEEEQLQQLKMQRQFDTLKEQRIRFLKQKAEEILDFTLPYLENNDQKTINFILDKYPTNDDIIKYLQEVKLADENLNNQDDDNNLFSYEYEQEINAREEKLLLPVETNETYRKIRAYAIKNKLTTQLYHLLEYPHFDLDAITQEVEDELLRPALGSPLDYKFDQLELNELTKCLSWQE